MSFFSVRAASSSAIAGCMRSCSSSRSFSSSGKTNVGFIGLGNMGLPMCENLIKSGKFNVMALDKFQERIDLAAQAGATPARDTQDIAESSDIIFTMLFNTDTVHECYQDSTLGLFKHAKKGSLMLDSTTIAPAAAKNLGEAGLKLGFRMCDAPVSGGVTGAQAGTLAFMCGGESEAFFEKDVKPFLEYMGNPNGIFYCGANGTGSIAKVCNNMALATQMISIAESVNMGIKLGMDPKLLSNVMNKSSARCWSGDTYNPCPGVMDGVPSSRDFERGFKMSLMVKDLRLAIENAKGVDADVGFGENSLKYYEDLMNSGYEEKDFGFVYEYVKKGRKMNE